MLPLIPADLLRALGLVLVPVAGVVAGWPSAAVMLLVTGGQWVLRWLQGGRALDWAGQAVLLTAGWCSVVGLYRRLTWLDLAVHAAVGAVLAALVAVAARAWIRRRSRRPNPSARTAGAADPARQAVALLGPGLAAAAVASAALALGVVWEVAEWWGHHVVTPEIGVGYDDTLGDLLADAAGALVGAWLAVARPRGAGR